MSKREEKREEIKCQCGKMFAACVDGHQDKEWESQRVKYEKLGCTSTIVDSPEGIKFETCSCPNMDGREKNQLKLDL